MYNRIKKILKFVLPKKFLRKNEKLLRRSMAFLYKGSKFKCNLCNFGLSKFISNERGGLLCPNCGSVSRSRRLWQVLSSELNDKVVLHFSPSIQLSKNFKNSNAKHYISTDYVGEFQADKQLDIQNINEQKNTFDTIICFHVLEHIENDLQAMSELYRVLKNNGVCYIQTPFKKGAIYEDKTITSKAGRLQHFGQEDHVRVYSVSGLVDRLKNVGFEIELLHFNNSNNNTIFGFSENETIIKAIKH